MSTPLIAIAGGGAAGFFAAIACAEAVGSRATVVIYEATAHLLAKVLVSGGGRCNVTHACFDPRQLVTRYPRGSRELLGAFHRWSPREMMAWLEARGVALKTEPDGRVFPATDDARTIADCLQRAARDAGVQVRTQSGIRAATARPEGGFELQLSTGERIVCARLLLATGGNSQAGGPALAQALGHTIEPPVPSLFTVNVTDARLTDLAGLAAKHVAVSVPGTKLQADGPLLVTHWGLSGPAILKLSAWGARELAQREYRFPLTVNFAPELSREKLREALTTARAQNPRKQLGTWCPLSQVPSRLWDRLLAAAKIAPTQQWAGLGNDALGALAAQIGAAEFAVTGKSTNKEEFVTCGGVRLREVDFKTMESKLRPGLHFAGELLDIDGLTGGFNFQAAWTTGYLAGQAMAASLNPAASDTTS